MKSLSRDQKHLICLYNGGTRAATICNLKEMRKELTFSEIELLAFTNSTIISLEQMTDAAFDDLDLIPDIFPEDLNGF